MSRLSNARLLVPQDFIKITNQSSHSIAIQDSRNNFTKNQIPKDEKYYCNDLIESEPPRFCHQNLTNCNGEQITSNGISQNYESTQSLPLENGFYSLASLNQFPEDHIASLNQLFPAKNTVASLLNRKKQLLTPESFAISLESSADCYESSLPDTSSSGSGEQSTNFYKPCDLDVHSQQYSVPEEAESVLRVPQSLSSARRKLQFDSLDDKSIFPVLQNGNNKHSGNSYDDWMLEEKCQSVEVPKIKRQHVANLSDLPPIGVFWDIENCRVPRTLSAIHVVKAIRSRFFSGYREAEFVCVCDTLKENTKVLEELNDTQINIIHVGSIKNAADDKLLQSIRRFADQHQYTAGATVVLISGDSDFATELYDLQYRKRIQVILVHNSFTQDKLKFSAHETVLFSDLTKKLPEKSSKQLSVELCKDITVWNLPTNMDIAIIKRRLHYLSSSLGGKGIYVKRGKAAAKISFQTPELAARAKKRIDGEDVYGNKLVCTFGNVSNINPPNETNNSHSYPTNQNGQEQICRFYDRAVINLRSKDQERVPAFSNPVMDLNSINVWNKPYSAPSSMNGTFTSHPTWVHQSTSQGRNNATPTSTFQSNTLSSRESSPRPSTDNRDNYNRSNYRMSSPVDDKKGFSMNDCSSYDTGRVPRISQPWLGNYSKGASASNNDFANQSTMMALGNMSLADTSQINPEEEDQSVTLVDRSYINDLWLKSRRILWNEATCALSFKEFEEIFKTKYGENPKMETFEKDLGENTSVVEDVIGGEKMLKLVPLQIFARDILILLNEVGGRMLLVNFENAYLNRFGIACRPATLGFPNLVALIQGLGDFASIKGRGNKRLIVLRILDVDLPSYCPPPPKNLRNIRENETWMSSASNTVQPPQTSFHQPTAPPPTTPIYPTDIPNSHMMLGLTPPQPSYHQPASPLIYPGSPAAQTGSVMWGQMWSPRYSMMPPLSPAAHYMMPTIPFNWGSLASPPMAPAGGAAPLPNANGPRAPISIHTLDQLGKVSPPKPSELPVPELLTSSSSSCDEQPPVAAVANADDTLEKDTSENSTLVTPTPFDQF